MTDFFDGKAVRAGLLGEITTEVAKMSKKPVLGVFLVGENEVCEKYVSLKARVAQEIGITVRVFRIDHEVKQAEVVEAIKKADADPEIDGVMVQMPLPQGMDKFEVVSAISPSKDVDGLRFCGGFHSEFRPPVVLAILEAIERSGKKLQECEVVIVGRGFLVGWPLEQCLAEAITGLVVADKDTKNLRQITKNADILISATGCAGLIKPEMVKDGAVLIDAGTAEVNGDLMGDIERETFKKASYYTPVPGGIGPVTVAMLLKNLVEAAKS